MLKFAEDVRAAMTYITQMSTKLFRWTERPSGKSVAHVMEIDKVWVVAVNLISIVITYLSDFFNSKLLHKSRKALNSSRYLLHSRMEMVHIYIYIYIS